MVGSSEMIPKPQIQYLADHGFAVVIPNYRLSPQVTVKKSFEDCEEAFDWARATLPGILKADHEVTLASDKIVALGHSAGGTIALHLASTKPVKAVTAFYPSLFIADELTTLGQPTSAPPFGAMPDFIPSDEDWASIKPNDTQLSEASLALPGTTPSARNKWQMHVIKHGEWLRTTCPDGDIAAIDPMTRISPDWPPVMIVQGEVDNLPGSGLELAQRAEKELKAGGVKEVELEVVQGETHMFDMSPMVGTTDLGPKWQAVVKGLDWVAQRA
jgi:acetyl esterase/lipase